MTLLILRFEPSEEISTATHHPTEDILAVGLGEGQIHFWRYSTLGETSNHLKETYHWHSQRCTSIQFTEDATYMISGGKEAVLVIWQLYTGRRQYIPALGSTIIKVAISPNAKFYAAATAGNCIVLLNAISSTIHKTITSLVRGELL